MMGRSIGYIAGFLFLAVVFSQPVWSRPKIFSQANLDVAKIEAKQQGKFLVAEFTADSCGPCVVMDQTAWLDPKVEEWINQHAVAVQIDVEKQSSVSAAFNVPNLPTILIYVAADQKTPFDRYSGYLTGPELLKWFQSVEKGQVMYGEQEETDAQVLDQRRQKEFQVKIAMTIAAAIALIFGAFYAIDRQRQAK